MIKGLILSYPTAAAIAPYTIVAFADPTSNSSVAPATDPAQPLVGTTGKIAASAAGQMVDVDRSAVPQVRLGGPVAAGDRLTSNGAGAAVKVTAAGQRVIGTAEQPGIAGDIIDYFAAPSVAQGA